MPRRRRHRAEEEAEPAHRSRAEGDRRRNFLAAEERKPEARHAFVERDAGADAVAGGDIREEFGNELFWASEFSAAGLRRAGDDGGGTVCGEAAIGVGSLGRCVRIATLSAIGCSSSGQAPQFETDVDVTPAEQNIGERIFVDTRWAQYFATHMTDVNSPLAVGDPVVAQTQTINGPLPGPFAGQSINCRSCHFVVEFQGVKGAGNRTYADFTTRSPIPRRDERIHIYAAQFDADGWLAAAAHWSAVPALRRRVHRSGRSGEENNHGAQFRLGLRRNIKPRSHISRT